MKDDTISRQAAIDAVKDRYYKYDRFAKVEELVWAIEALPSVEAEQRWIPCSERLPERNGLKLKGVNDGIQSF